MQLQEVGKMTPEDFYNILIDRIERIEKKIDRQFEKYDEYNIKNIQNGTKINIIWAVCGVIGLAIITDIITRIIK